MLLIPFFKLTNKLRTHRPFSSRWIWNKASFTRGGNIMLSTWPFSPAEKGLSVVHLGKHVFSFEWGGPTFWAALHRLVFISQLLVHSSEVWSSKLPDATSFWTLFLKVPATAEYTFSLHVYRTFLSNQCQCIAILFFPLVHVLALYIQHLPFESLAYSFLLQMEGRFVCREGILRLRVNHFASKLINAG